VATISSLMPDGRGRLKKPGKSGIFKGFSNSMVPLLISFNISGPNLGDNDH
jgi:hypothetical protein